MANEVRLIDANALKGKLIRELNKTGKYTAYECGLDDAIFYLDEQPTVDAVPVVHGRWVDEYPYVRCSECYAEWLNCRTDNEPKLFYYCPNCGAKMDGDGNA